MSTKGGPTSPPRNVDDRPRFTAEEWFALRDKLTAFINAGHSPLQGPFIAAPIAEALLREGFIDTAALAAAEKKEPPPPKNMQVLIHADDYPMCSDASCRATHVHEHGGDCTPACVCHLQERSN